MTGIFETQQQKLFLFGTCVLIMEKFPMKNVHELLVYYTALVLFSMYSGNTRDWAKHTGKTHICYLVFKVEKKSWKWRTSTYTVSMKNRHDHLAVATHFTNVTTTHPWLLNSWYKAEMIHITEVVTPPCWSTWDSFQQGASHLLWVIDLAYECQWWGSLLLLLLLLSCFSHVRLCATP